MAIGGFGEAKQPCWPNPLKTSTPRNWPERSQTRNRKSTSACRRNPCGARKWPITIRRQELCGEGRSAEVTPLRRAKLVQYWKLKRRERRAPAAGIHGNPPRPIAAHWDHEPRDRNAEHRLGSTASIPNEPRRCSAFQFMGISSPRRAARQPVIWSKFPSAPNWPAPDRIVRPSNSRKPNRP